ncbi:MAG: FG-GAP-like repeat-containing protein, partial [Candidatus Eisenbacteria bacterium]
VRYTRTIDMLQPAGVTGVVGAGAATSITLVWKKTASTDLAGYNIYRGTSQVGPFTKVNLAPTDRTAYYVDASLPALTRFYYQVSAVDSSGNESSKSAVASASTNPPLHSSYPLTTERSMPSPPAIGNIDNSNDSSYEIVAGSNVIYAWHVDGTPVRDADGTERAARDFTTEGSYYAGGVTIADLDLNGTWELIAPDWDGKSLHVFEADGSDFPGFPVFLNESVWSSAAVGNIDADPQPEIVFGSRGNKIFAFNWDGTEVRDGDSNPSTIGVFKVMPGAYNDSSPALADLDGDGKLDIIYAGYDGMLYAWRFDGTNLPGFPQNLFASTTSSPAVGDIDNDGMLEIAITANNNKLYVFKANGTYQPGFPVTNVQADGVSKYPSPALADMEGLGQKDIVINTTDGYVKVFRPNGTQLSQWTNVRYSYTAKASESSVIVADIDGDGQNEVLVGGEDANLYAFDNDGSLMAGFPIKLNGEVRGTPLVWDLDKDGLTEILVSCWDKNVYLWDYPGAFSPNSAPPWAMWRHDQFRTGRLSSPIVVGTNTVAFSAQDGVQAGLGLTFALPPTPEAGGQFDLYRAAGAGAVGSIATALPSDFTRINTQVFATRPGDLVSYNDVSALPGEVYRYMLVRRAERPGDAFVGYGPFAAMASAEAPKVAFVSQNFPNPASSGRTSIAYGVPEIAGPAVHTTLRFFDVRGRVVRTLVDQVVPPGRYQVTWDGKDDAGARVGSGVYFYEYVAGPTRLRKKALLIAP